MPEVEFGWIFYMIVGAISVLIYKKIEKKIFKKDDKNNSEE